MEKLVVLHLLDDLMADVNKQEGTNIEKKMTEVEKKIGCLQSVVKDSEEPTFFIFDARHQRHVWWHDTR
jgi:hypothetical protein